jgi:hypothetical protein
MVSCKLVYNLKDEETRLAEKVLDDLHAESRMFVDKIGPGRSDFSRMLRKFDIKKFPTVIVAGTGQFKTVAIDEERYFKDRESLRNVLSEAFLKVR